MMKRTASILIAGFLACSGTYAQQNPYLAKLTEGLLQIRNDKSSSKALNKTVIEWSASECPKMTLMDDLKIDKENEFFGKGSNLFKANQLVTYVHSRQNVSLTSKGEFFTSTEKGVHYSAIEKSIKKGHTASYTLEGHVGDQEFVILSYNPKTKFSVTVNDKPAKTIGDGVQAICLPEVLLGDVIKLTIHNEGPSDDSFVILNHNPQKL